MMVVLGVTVLGFLVAKGVSLYLWSGELPAGRGMSLAITSTAFGSQALAFGSAMVLLRMVGSNHDDYAVLSTTLDPETGEPVLGGANGKEGKKGKAGIGRLLGLARDEKWLIIVGTVCLFFSSGASLSIPLYFGKILNVVSTTTGSWVKPGFGFSWV